MNETIANEVERAATYCEDMRQSLIPHKITLQSLEGGAISVYSQDIGKVIFSGYMDQIALFLRGLLWGSTIRDISLYRDQLIEDRNL